MNSSLIVEDQDMGKENINFGGEERERVKGQTEISVRVARAERWQLPQERASMSRVL